MKIRIGSLAAIKTAECDDSQSSFSGASCMRFASTTISKAFLFIFYPDCKKIKRQLSDCEYAQIHIKPSTLEFWSSIATGFSGPCRQIYKNIGNAQSHSTKAINLLISSNTP
jgi:hypothetical protein